MALEAVRAAGVYDKEGALLASYRSDRFAAAGVPDSPPAAGRSFLRDVMNVSGVIEIEGQRSGSVFLQYDLSALRSRVRRFLLLVAGVALGALVVAYLLLASLQRAITAPFLGVARLMEEVARGDLTGSVHIAGGGELGRLGESISRTIANLREVIGKVDESFLFLERVTAGLDRLSEAVDDSAQKEKEEEEVVGTLGGTTASLSGIADRVSTETDAWRISTEKNLASLLELMSSVGVMTQNAKSFAASAEGTRGAIQQMSAAMAQAEEGMGGIEVVSRGTAQVEGVGAVLQGFVSGAEETNSLNEQIAEGSDRQTAESARVAQALVEVSQMAEHLLGSSGEQKRTSRHIGDIADETGKKALLMWQSTTDQLATVNRLKDEVEGAKALSDRLLAGAVSSRDAVAAVVDSTNVIRAVVAHNRSRAQVLREAIDQLGTQAREIRTHLAGFRLRN